MSSNNRGLYNDDDDVVVDANDTAFFPPWAPIIAAPAVYDLDRPGMRFCGGPCPDLFFLL